MRKASLALALLLGLAFPQIASAHDFKVEDDNPSYSETEDEEDNYPPRREHDDESYEDRHNHLNELYDDVTEVVIPPIAIRPGHHRDPNFFQLPNIEQDPFNGGITSINPPSSDIDRFFTTELGKPSGTKVSLAPVQGQPVEIKNIVLTTKTPSDEFMTGAVLMGGGLGAVAFGLLTFTSLHTVRQRSKGKIKKS